MNPTSYIDEEGRLWLVETNGKHSKYTLVGNVETPTVEEEKPKTKKKRTKLKDVSIDLPE